MGPPNEMTAPEVGRAFVAVRPPEAVLDAIAGRVGAAGAAMATRVGTTPPGPDRAAGARWAPREQWHVTLQFLGAVRHLAPVVDALAVAAAAGSPFNFRVGGAGAFPGARRAKVIWLGAAEGAEPMQALAASVGAALDPVGYPAEGRPFRAHLTLARLREAGDVRPVMAALGSDPVGPAWAVDEVVLYESRLSPAGPTYTALASVPLVPGVTTTG